MTIDQVNPAAAINAYSNSQNIGKGMSSGNDSVSTFGDLLKSAAKDSVDSIKKSEQVSAQAIMGEAQLADVVQAVTDAELTLQTVVAVRDRMISAYQEIMRMPI